MRLIRIFANICIFTSNLELALFILPDFNLCGDSFPWKFLLNYKGISGPYFKKGLTMCGTMKRLDFVRPDYVAPRLFIHLLADNKIIFRDQVMAGVVNNNVLTHYDASSQTNNHRQDPRQHSDCLHVSHKMDLRSKLLIARDNDMFQDEIRVPLLAAIPKICPSDISGFHEASMSTL